MVLLHLLHHHTHQDYSEAFIHEYNLWSPRGTENIDTDAHLHVVNPLYPWDQVRFLLLNDAQDTYDDNCLWIGFLKGIYGRIGNYQVVLFCSYRSTKSHASMKGTPPIFRDTACFSLQPNAEMLGLLLNKKDFWEVVIRYDPICKKFNNSLFKCLFTWTASYAGALCNMLYCICKVIILTWYMVDIG